MKQELLDETARTYSFPSRVKYVGDDLILTTRDFFIILTSEDIKKIKEKVIGEHKNIFLQNETIIAFMKDNYIVLEYKRDNDFQRVMMVNSSVFS